MAKKTDKALDKDSVVRAALDLATEKDWAEITLADIAVHADVSLAELHALFEDKSDILSAFGRMIDAQILENARFDEEETCRDRLFDLLMERFELLNEYRAGVVSILKSFRFDPKQAVISLPHLAKSMTWMMEAAQMETYGMRGALRVLGLSGVYLRVLYVWQDDDSPDLGKTMAALDKALGTAEQAANTFSL